MEILDLIERLESIAAGAKKVPTTGRVMVDAKRLLELVDQMRLAVPRSVQESQEVLERRDHIITQTISDAKRIKASADTEARALVAESELLKTARERAQELITDAEERASVLNAALDIELRNRRDGVDRYAQDVLMRLEQEMLSVLSTVRKGREALEPVGHAVVS